MDNKKNCSIENIFKLDGTVPLVKAIPFGLQHVLAMFVSNLIPITIIVGASATAVSGEMLALLLQNAMFIAGIATMIQLFPIWRIGAKLPIVMGVSFTFVAALSAVSANLGYNAVIGCVLVGGIFEGCLGLFAKTWKKFIKPIVSATVVTAIGMSLFTVGARSFGGGYAEDFGSAQNLIIATATLVTVLAWTVLVKGYMKQLAVLAGLIVGYIVSLAFGAVDFSNIMANGTVSLPRFLPFMPEFNVGAIISVCIIFLVSATETIGDTTAMVVTGLDRDITDDEVAGSLACDGFSSAISSLFGCSPVTSFSQNVGLISMTKVVNRFTIATGAACLILAGLFPPIGGFFASLPQPVLGGCTIMMFGSIVTSGMRMIATCGFSEKNVTIASLSLAIGIGFTASSEAEIWRIFPPIIQNVFGHNVVAVVFIIALILSFVLPEDMGIKSKIKK